METKVFSFIISRRWTKNNKIFNVPMYRDSSIIIESLQSNNVLEIFQELT